MKNLSGFYPALLIYDDMTVLLYTDVSKEDVSHSTGRLLTGRQLL